MNEPKGSQTLKSPKAKYSLGKSFTQRHLATTKSSIFIDEQNTSQQRTTSLKGLKPIYINETKNPFFKLNQMGLPVKNHTQNESEYNSSLYQKNNINKFSKTQGDLFIYNKRCDYSKSKEFGNRLDKKKFPIKLSKYIQTFGKRSMITYKSCNDYQNINSQDFEKNENNSTSRRILTLENYDFENANSNYFDGLKTEYQPYNNTSIKNSDSKKKFTQYFNKN